MKRAIDTWSKKIEKMEKLMTEYIDRFGMISFSESMYSAMVATSRYKDKAEQVRKEIAIRED